MQCAHSRKTMAPTLSPTPHSTGAILHLAAPRMIPPLLRAVNLPSRKWQPPTTSKSSRKPCKLPRYHDHDPAAYYAPSYSSTGFETSMPLTVTSPSANWQGACSFSLSQYPASPGGYPPPLVHEALPRGHIFWHSRVHLACTSRSLSDYLGRVKSPAQLQPHIAEFHSRTSRLAAFLVSL